MVIVVDGVPCQGACSGRGHVEAYCSGRAADKLAQRVLGPDATAHDLVAQHHPALGEIGHHLGVAIGSLVNIFGSTRVVIGGGFGIAAFDQLRAAGAARCARARRLRRRARSSRSSVRSSARKAGLIGAALVALEAH